MAIGASAPVPFSPAPQADDFDGWMQAYPCVVPWGDRQVMFYNGNEVGQSGFGWAVLDA